MPSSPPQVNELRLSALFWLAECDAKYKAAGARKLAQAWAAGEISLDRQSAFSASEAIPGHPEQPKLVAPRLVKRRAMNTLQGRATLIHALVHIEFNAINLALDAIWRFPDMPQAYYSDWLQVADEEVLHFTLLADHLQVLGYAYGDFPAHNSLWEMADKTSNDLLARIALVPRTLEARGLDVIPAIRSKLVQAGDSAVAEILDIILHDEIGHVSIGNRWYLWLCQQRGLEPVVTYAQLAEEYHAPALRGPLNLAARRAAGFSEMELAALPNSLSSGLKGIGCKSV